MTNGPADNSASKRLQREAQMRFNAMDPMERFEAEKQAYYDRFDAAVETLPPEKAVRVDLMSSYRDDKGTWHLRDIAGQPVAQVLEEGAQTPEPRDPAPAKPRTAEADNKLLRVCAKKINMLNEALGMLNEALGMLDEALGKDILPKLLGRIEKLEERSAIDAEAIAELERIAERVETIETRGFRFVGKYQAPATYKTGDVVTYRDALWHCVQDAKVGDRPSTSGHKWALMLAGNQE